MINLAKINKKYCGSQEAVFMWEAIAACATVFMSWLSWQKHQREKEEHEAKYRRGKRESRRFTFPEIETSQPTQKPNFFRLTEVDIAILNHYQDKEHKFDFPKIHQYTYT